MTRACTGFITAFITNPIWVVKTRMFTTRSSQARAYRGVLRKSGRLVPHLSRLCHYS